MPYNHTAPAPTLDLTQPITREQYVATVQRTMEEMQRVVASIGWCGEWLRVGIKFHPWFTRTENARGNYVGVVEVPDIAVEYAGVNLDWLTDEGRNAFTEAKGAEYAEQLRLLRGRILGQTTSNADTAQITLEQAQQILEWSGLGRYAEPTEVFTYEVYVPSAFTITNTEGDADAYTRRVREAWTAFITAVGHEGPTAGRPDVNRRRSTGQIPAEATAPLLPR